VLALAGQREVRAQLPGQALLLAVVDGQQLQRPHELAQMLGRGRDHEQRARGAQNAAQLGAVARREHVEHQCGRRVRDRQRPPRIAADRADPRVRAGRAAQRELRAVQGQPRPARQLVKHGGQVVTGARPDISHAAGRRPGPAGRARRPAQLGGQARVVARRQEVLAGLHHRGGVAAGWGAPGREQAHITLPGDVEGVPSLAPHRTAGPAQVHAAVGAHQVLDHVVEHASIVVGGLLAAFPAGVHSASI
jgi:hypothetical protein